MRRVDGAHRAEPLDETALMSLTPTWAIPQLDYLTSKDVIERTAIQVAPLHAAGSRGCWTRRVAHTMTRGFRARVDHVDGWRNFSAPGHGAVAQR